MYARGHRFIAMQSLLHHEGVLEMSGKQWALLYWLNFEVQRRSNNRLLCSNKQIAEAIGTHVVSVPAFRTRLEELGVLRAEKARGGYFYTLLDATTGTPINRPFIETRNADSWASQESITVPTKTLEECDFIPDTGFVDDDEPITA
jgi:hypothetical protein